jgi:hypothetical protein
VRIGPGPSKIPEAVFTYRNTGLTPAKSLLAIPSSFIREQRNGPPEPQTNPEGVACPEPGIHRDVRLGRGEALPPGVMRQISTVGRFLGNDQTNPKIRDLGGFITGPLGHEDGVNVRRGWLKRWYVVLYISYYDQFGEFSPG